MVQNVGPGPRRPHRTWPQRLALSGVAVTALACFALAATFQWGNTTLSKVKRVDVTPLPDTTVPAGEPAVGDSSTSAAGAPSTSSTAAPSPLVAQNYLLVGSDSRACIDPNSPYAGAFISNSDTGENSDTIMVVRVDPVEKLAAILSFPRDLWVSIDGTNYKSKINSAYSHTDPRKLIRTVEKNFGFDISHYVEVDFCAFKKIVDAVGGVKIPFTFPTRDLHTGLDVQTPGCVAFGGDASLAYARSRYYEWSKDGGKTWMDDGTSDYGRIARQQDFIRRVLQKAIDKGARNPAVARSLLDALLQDVKVDTFLTIGDLLSVSQALKTLDPAAVKSYRFEGRDDRYAGEDIIRPIDSDNNRNVLAVLQGKARLSEAPIPTSPNAPTTAKTVPATTVAPAPGATTTVPEVAVVDNKLGVVPPDDPTCR